MISPYLKDNALTYQEFEHIFSMLSKQEKYSVINILIKNDIDLIDSPNKTIDEFKILYSNNLFSNPNNNSGEIKKNSHSNNVSLKLRNKIALSNRTLIKMIQEGNPQAKQDFCIKNRGLVDDLASKYQRIWGSKMEFEDLHQAGMTGMIKAAERFDLNRETKFSTYAIWWIKQAIVREIQDNGYTVRIPVHRAEQIQKVMRLDAKYAYEKDYNKRLVLISNESEMTIDLVEDCIRLFHQFVKITSLDIPIGEKEDISLGELIPDEGGVSIDDIVMFLSLRESLEDVLDTLTPREEKIIRLRFGLDDGQARTLEEVGQLFGVTRERIRQIEKKALRKLRHPSRSRKLKDYLD